MQTTVKLLTFGLAVLPAARAKDGYLRHGRKLSTLDDLDDQLESIRRDHRLPALGAAIVTLDESVEDEDGIPWMATTGVRRRWSRTRVTDDDLWHLGSCTKAMTSTMVARLVESGVMPSWELTLQEAFPDVDMSGLDHAGITISQLLTHTSGLQRDPTWNDYRGETDLVEGRKKVLMEALSTPLLFQPSDAYSYSNIGYILAGAMAEAVSGKSWEILMQEEVFDPLGITSVGVGQAGVPFRNDQPWPHRSFGLPLLFDGSLADLPAVAAPAGMIHATLRDWAKFVRVHLNESGTAVPGYLTPETMERLHTAPPNSEIEPGIGYAYGWATLDGEDGPRYIHSGSNSVNYATVWILPEQGFAALIVTNQGGAGDATGEVANALTTAWMNKDAP